MSQFIAGATSLLQGARYVVKNPVLLRYAIVPLIINLILTVLVFGLLIFLGSIFVSQIHPWFHQSDNAVIQVLAWVIEILLVIVLFVICAYLSLLTWIVVNAVVSGKFYGSVAIDVEKKLGANESDFESLSFTAEIVGTLTKLAVWLGGNAVAMTLNGIPILGSVLALACSLYLSGLVLGLEFMSHSLGARGMTQSAQLRWGRANAPAVIGLGGATFGGMLIPFAGAFVPIFATVAGVLLYHEMESNESLNPMILGDSVDSQEDESAPS